MISILMILIPAMRVTTKGELALSVLNEEKKRFFLSRANKTRGKLTLIVSDEKRLFLLRWKK
jgi:hypothetical protein